MKHWKHALALVVVAVVATGCCCPLQLCLPSNVPTGMAPLRDGDTIDVQRPIAAAAPVTTQRF